MLVYVFHEILYTIKRSVFQDVLHRTTIPSAKTDKSTELFLYINLTTNDCLCGYVLFDVCVHRCGDTRLIKIRVLNRKIIL